MKLREILGAKSDRVYSIHPEATLDEVVREMVRYRIGALMVFERRPGKRRPRVLGIITERDVLRAQAARARFEQTRVAEAMSAELVTAAPDDEIETAMRLMTYRRVRHLPVLEGERLLGVVSIGDVVKAQRDTLVMENHYMQGYIQGEVADIDEALRHH
jgi:CBS domain-containing protein